MGGLLTWTSLLGPVSYCRGLSSHAANFQEEANFKFLCLPPPLADLVGAPGLFRPKLLLHQGMLHMRMDAGDMLGDGRVRALCFAAREETGLLLSQKVGKRLAPPLIFMTLTTGPQAWSFKYIQLS